MSTSSISNIGFSGMTGTLPTKKRTDSGGSMNVIKRWFEEWRPSAVTLGAPVYPLLVLFGLNAVDELDRSAFGVLLPDIRDHFHLHNAQALAIVSVTTILVTLIE